jgi:hypothetical protein
MALYHFDSFCPRSLIVEVSGSGDVVVKVQSPKLGTFDRRFHARGLCGAHVHVPLVGDVRVPVPFAFYEGATLELPDNVHGVKLFGDLASDVVPPGFKVYG